MDKIETSGLTTQQKREKLLLLRELLKRESTKEIKTLLMDADVNDKVVAERYEPYLMSDIQESFLIGKFYGKSQDHVGCHIYFEFEEKDLDAERLNRAWNRVIDRHEMLRTIMLRNKTQRLLKESEYEQISFPVYDLKGRSSDAIARHIENIRREMSHKCYDTEQWPLFQICITNKNDGCSIIHFSIDEWITDGYSMSILLSQWYQIYRNPEMELFSPGYTFREYVLVQKQNESTPRYARDLDYFMKKYKSLPNGPQLPYQDIQADQNRQLTGLDYYPRKRYEMTIASEYWDQIKQKATSLKVSLTAVLITCFGDILRKYSATPEFSILSTYFNRPPIHADIEKVVGPFVTTNIIHMGMSAQSTLDERIQQCQKEIWEDLDHSSVSGIRALRELRVREKEAPNLSIPIVFTSMLNRAGKEAQGSLLEKAVYSVSQTPQVCLDHQVYEHDGKLQILWDTIEEYFKPGILESMFQDYEKCLKAFYTIENGADTEANRKPESSHNQKPEKIKLTDMQQSYLYSRNNRSWGGYIYQEFDVYNMDPKSLNTAWNDLTAAHEMLRIHIDDHGFMQVNHHISQYEFEYHDLSALDRNSWESKLQEIRDEQQNAKLPDQDGRMYKIAITLFPDGSFRLHISIDPIIADGKSIHLLYHQLFLAGKGGSIRKPKRTFGDYVAYIEAAKAGADKDKILHYWKEKFAGLPSGPKLPYHEGQPGQAHKRLEGRLSHWGEIKTRLKRLHLDPDAFLVAIFTDTLKKWTDGSDYTVVYVNWNRPAHWEDINDVIGEFTTLSWIPVTADGTSLLETARKIQDLIQKEYQYSKLSGLSQLRKRLLAGTISLPVVYTNRLQSLEGGIADDIRRGYGASFTPGVFLDHMSYEDDQDLYYSWDYDSGVFYENVITGMFEDYQKLLDEYISQLQEKESKTNASYVSIHGRFESIAEKYADKSAITFQGRQITYRTLNERSNQLAAYLLQAGAKPGKLIAICLERSIDMIVTILAVLKSGAAYVPIDPHYPAGRINLILEDSQSFLLITEESLVKNFQPVSYHELDTVVSNVSNDKMITIEELQKIIKNNQRMNPAVEVSGNDCAYVIYTSGSTGKPKGVLIPHQNVMRLFSQTDHWFQFQETDVWTLFHSFAFDFSVWEIWGALLYGGRLVLVPYGVSRTPNHFYQMVSDENVTVLNQTPTAFYQFMSVDEREKSDLSLRYVIFGGEALNPGKLRSWYDRHDDRNPRLINMYGITETTVHVTYRELTQEDSGKNASVIGVPIPDLTLYLLNEDMTEVSSGETGEIYVGGAGLAIGYLNRPELTKERFIMNPFRPGQRLYKTGDIARMLTDGELEYLGRSDLQIKVRGFRIELGDIEAALLKYGEIKEAVATIKDEDTNDPKIVAYVILKSEVKPKVKEIRSFLRKILPDYMIPNIFVPVENYPMTENGKLCRKALPWPVENILYRFGENEDTSEAKSVSHSTEVLRNEALNNEEPDNEALRKEIEDILIKVFEASLGSQEVITVNDDIFDLGATSLTIMDVITKIAETYSYEIPIEIFLTGASIAALTEHTLREVGMKNHPYSEPAAGLTQKAVKETGEPVEIKDPEAVEQPEETEDRKETEYPEETDVAKTEESAQPDYDLGKPNFKKDAYISYTHKPLFSAGTISFADFSGLFGLLRMKKVNGETKYLYPASGGRNAVQTYVYVKKEMVENIGEGLYYYHPLKNSIQKITVEIPNLADSLVGCHKELYEKSGFAIFFVAQLNALLPVYMDYSRILSKIDGGYMIQLLLERQQEFQIQFTPLPGLDFARIEENFYLDGGHQYIYALAGHYSGGGGKEEHNAPGLSDYLKEHKRGLNQHFIRIPDYEDTDTVLAIQREKKFNILTKKELVQLTKRQPQIRKDLDNDQEIQLADIIYEDKYYTLRSSQRSFLGGMVPHCQFAGFLSLMHRKQDGSQRYGLYVPPLGISGIGIYVYVPEEGVECVEEGVYRYEAGSNSLRRVSSRLSVPIHMCHTPFNLSISKKARFYIFFVARTSEILEMTDSAHLHYAEIESGMCGQTLMDHQAEFGIGMVPVGGMDFERIRKDFGLAPEHIYLHSIMCGAVEYHESKNAADLIQNNESRDGIHRDQMSYQKVSVGDKKSGDESYPLSYGQQSLFYEYLSDPGRCSYNTAYHVRIHKELDVAILKKAFQLLMDKHILLRATFELINGVPSQVIHEKCYLPFKLVNACYCSEEELLELNKSEYRIPFTLESKPAFRITLFRVSEADSILMFNIHHIITDYLSTGLMISDLWNFYETMAKGFSSTLQIRTDNSYIDFINWQKEYVASREGEKALTYWKKIFRSGQTGLELFTANKPFVDSKPTGATIYFNIDKALTDRYKELAKKEKKTLNALVLAAYKILLSIYCDKTKISIGTMANARGMRSFEHTAGYFINPLLIQSELKSGMTFRELADQIHLQIFEAMKYQNYPYSLVLEKMGSDTGSEHNFLFQVTFQLITRSGSSPAGDPAVAEYKIPQQEGQFDLEMELIEQGFLSGRIAYNNRLFGKEEMLQFKEHFINLLGQIIEKPDSRIQDLNVIGNEEEKLLLNRFSFTKLEEHEPYCIHQLIEQQAAQNPENCAVVSFDNMGNRSAVNYDELNRSANRLAGYLIKQSGKENALVGICLRKSIDLIVAVLAVYKAGMAYIPIDPDYPQERYEFIIRDADPETVIHSSGQQTNVFRRASSEIQIDIDSIQENLTEADGGNPNLLTDENQVAYIIYTSGSTGVPKGVKISHKGALYTFYGYLEAYSLLNVNRRHLQMSNFTFDVFVGDYLRALCSGGTLILCLKENMIDAKKLYQLIEEEQIHFAEFVPAVMRSLTQYLEKEQKQINCMRGVVVSSDSWTMNDLNYFRRYFHENTEFISAYGVTEASIDSTYMLCKDIDPDTSGFVPIGRALSNVRTYIVTKGMKPAPLYVPGELLLGGPGVAQGYLNRDELTKEKFIPDPFLNDGSILYRTGDLVKYLPTGRIEFLGRIDNQIKIRGLRIELGEIETVLTEYPDVAEGCVAARKDSYGESFLVGYYTNRENCTADVMQLRQYFKRKLPEYLVPAAFMELKKFPLNSNGKIDRGALPETTGLVSVKNTAVRLPETDIQKALASVWMELLRLEQTDIDSSFFHVGGHSFLAVRLLDEIKRKLDYTIPLPDFLKAPTIQDMAQYLEPETKEKESGETSKKPGKLAESNVFIKDKITDIDEVRGSWQRPAKILLTGSTGFLGSHLLADILEMYVEAKVYCLVRGRDQSSCEQRLRNVLEKHMLYDKVDEGRIEVLPGNLELSCLGLPEDVYEQICKTVDVIFHCGAYVNFAYPAEVLEKANVGGTMEVMKLAVAHKMKQVHYISTTSVYDNLDVKNRSFKSKIIIKENTPLFQNDKLKTMLGYSESKWYAEQAICRARARGVLVNIYRPNIISGNSETGVWNKTDFASNTLMNIIKTGILPRENACFNWAPVDYVSAAIVYLSKQASSINKNFNLTSPHKLTFRDLSIYLRKCGHPIRRIPYRNWLKEMERVSVGNAKQEMPQEMLESIKSQNRNVYVVYDDSNTNDGLIGSDICCPKIDDEIIKKYCAALKI